MSLQHIRRDQIIHEQLSRLVPTKAPHLTDEELVHLTGMTPEDLLDMHVPPVSGLRWGYSQHRESADGPTFTSVRTDPQDLPVLAVIEQPNDAAILIEVPVDLRQAAAEALDGGRQSWFNFVREQVMTVPGAFMGWFPTAKAAHAQMHRYAAFTPGEEKRMQSVSQHLTIAFNSLSIAAGILAREPQQDKVAEKKLVGIVDATLEEFNAPNRPDVALANPSTAGALPDQKGADRRSDLEAEQDDDAEGEDD